MRGSRGGSLKLEWEEEGKHHREGVGEWGWWSIGCLREPWEYLGGSVSRCPMHTDVGVLLGVSQ